MTVGTITDLRGFEILDSRGRPTVLARCRLEGGASASAGVPSGLSTGSNEARELRDGDVHRHDGLGCRRAASAIGTEIAGSLVGRSFDQTSVDKALVDLDGTADKRRLGANAILAVSLAFARATAVDRREPLFRTLAVVAGDPMPALPRPMINLFSGGKHAGEQVALQDVQIMPLAFDTMDDLLAAANDVYRAAAGDILRRYAMRELTADEGGLAPPFESPERMLEAAVRAIEIAGFTPGEDVALAVDVAASHFRQGDTYVLAGRTISSEGMIELVDDWTRRFPIASVEDGLAEDDWPSWPCLRSRLHGRCLTLGDDLLCTNPTLVQRAVDSQAADSLLLKVNQIGTLTEAAETLRRARDAGWRVVASARSGETEDDWLADLAAGWAADHVKVGSVRQSERLAKYNRLLLLEAEHGLRLRPWRQPPEVPAQNDCHHGRPTRAGSPANELA